MPVKVITGSDVGQTPACGIPSLRSIQSAHDCISISPGVAQDVQPIRSLILKSRFDFVQSDPGLRGKPRRYWLDFFPPSEALFDNLLLSAWSEAACSVLGKSKKRKKASLWS